MTDYKPEPSRAENLRLLYKPLGRLRFALASLRVDTDDIDRLTRKVQVARFESLHRNAPETVETCNARLENTSRDLLGPLLVLPDV